MKRIALLLVAATASTGLPAFVVLSPTSAVAQARDSRPLSAPEVRELRRLLGDMRDQRDVARRRAAADRSDLRRVAAIFGLPSNASPDRIADELRQWADADAAIRLEIDRLGAVVAELQAGSLRDAGAGYVRDAAAAFEEGRLGDAEQILSRLQALRASDQTTGRRLWREAVLARADLLEQQRRFIDAEEILIEGEREAEVFLQSELRLDRSTFRSRRARSVFERAKRVGDETLMTTAVELADQALTFTDRETASGAWAEIQLLLGEAQSALGGLAGTDWRYANASAAFTAARDGLDPSTLQWASATTGLANVNAQIALKQRSMDHYAQAVEAYEAAITFFDTAGDPMEAASVRMLLAQLQSSAGADNEAVRNIDAALRVISDGAETMRQEGWREGVAWMMHGAVYFERGRIRGTIAAMPDTFSEDMDTSISSYRRAIERLNPAEYPLMAANAHYSLGNAYSEKGDLRSAVEAFNDALAAAGASAAPLLLAAIQYNLGLAQVRLGERGERPRLIAAERAFANALQIFEREGPSESAAMARRGLARARAALQGGASSGDRR